MPKAPDPRSVSRDRSTDPRSRMRRHGLQRLLPALVLTLAVVSVPLLLVSAGGLSRLEGLRRERSAVELEISRLNKRVEELRAGATAIKTDPAAVERAARDQLGLVRRTEVVFQFEPATPSARAERP